MLKLTLISSALLLAIVPFASQSTSCSTGGCGDSNSSLSGSQQQTDYNTLTQSPTMALSGSNSNSVVNASTLSTMSTSISADGGLSVSGSCGNDTAFITATMGGNEVSTNPNNYSSESLNGSITAGYVWTIGEAKDLCVKSQKVNLRAQELAYSKLLIKTCLTFINSGIDIHVLAKMDKTYEYCPNVLAQAQQNYHGHQAKLIADKAVAEYRAKREANMRAVGVDPSQEHIVYMK